MIQSARSRMLGLTAVLAAVISLPLTASAATHAHSTHNASSPHPVAVACGHDYVATNGSCMVDLAAINPPFSDTPDVVVVHIGPQAAITGTLIDSAIDPSAIEIVAPSTSPATVANYVEQQLHQFAACGHPSHLVVTVGGTAAVSPLYNRAIAAAVAPTTTIQIGGDNAAWGTIALADALMLYQRGGPSALQQNVDGLAAIAARGYGALIWPASR